MQQRDGNSKTAQLILELKNTKPKIKTSEEEFKDKLDTDD